MVYPGTAPYCTSFCAAPDWLAINTAIEAINDTPERIPPPLYVLIVLRFLMSGSLIYCHQTGAHYRNSYLPLRLIVQSKKTLPGDPCHRYRTNDRSCTRKCLSQISSMGQHWKAD